MASCRNANLWDVHDVNAVPDNWQQEKRTITKGRRLPIGNNKLNDPYLTVSVWELPSSGSRGSFSRTWITEVDDLRVGDRIEKDITNTDTDRGTYNRE